MTAPRIKWPWYGTLHALRLYSRELSQDERLQNYRADLVRFFGVTPTTGEIAASVGYAVETNPPGSPEVAETTEAGDASALFRVDLRTGAREIIRGTELLPLTWSAAQLETVTAPYTTDGLINRWDGIDNAGTGVHDSSATVWKDLAGNLDMELLANGKWKANALVCAGAAAQATTKASAYTTIETAYKMTSTSGRIMVTSGLNTRFVVFDWIDSNKNVEEYFSGLDANTLTIKRATQLDRMHTSAAVYSGNTVSAIYSEGVKDVSGFVQKNSWGVGDGKMMVGDRINGKAYPWTGEIYAIRFYNRALTDAEIANDRLIDMLRFDAKPLLENLPDGVRYSVTAIELAGEGDDLTTWTPKEGGVVKVLADKAPAGSCEWHPAKGVWKLKLEFYSGNLLLRTDESLFDLRHFKAGGLSIIIR